MFDAYRISVRLSLVNGMSAGLAAIGKELSVVNKAVDGTQARFYALHREMQKVKTIGIVGGVMAGAGFGALAMLKGPYDEAKKLAQAQANFQTLNLSALENTEAFGKAASMSHKILGTTITENVKSIHDLHTAFGDLHHAINSADEFAKFSFVAKTMNDGRPVEGLVYSAAKALEHRGGKVMNDDAAFKTELDLMERVYLGSRGKVNPGEFFHASQTGKLAYTLMDKEELYGPFAAYMQSKSGATAGTAAMTFSSSLIGGHMTNKAKGFLAELDLWDEKVSPKRVKMLHELSQGMSAAERKSMGMLTPTSGGLKEEYMDLAVHRQSQFVQNILAPAIRKRYGLDMSDEAVATKLMSVFNRNTSDFMGEYVVNAMKFSKDAAIFNKSKGIGDAYQHYMKSPEGAEEAATAAWTNLKTVIGSIYIKPITEGLLSLASGLTKLGAWTSAHPDITKALVSSFIALAGALAFGGTVILLGAAFRALGIAMAMQSIGGIGGVASLSARLLGIGGGLSSVAGVTGLASLGVTLGSLAVGLGVLFGAVNAMAWLFNWIAPNTNPTPGTAAAVRAGLGGGANHIAVNKDHPGEVWARSGHGGFWKPDPSNYSNEGSRFVSSAKSSSTVVTSNLVVDGRVLAKVVNTVNNGRVSQPQSGVSRFDPGMTAISPGMNTR